MIAIIGAGVAGLTCARRLQEAGHEVSVFEKSRSLGGRVSCRRVRSDVTFHHGCQYLSASDPRFEHQLGQWHKAGLIRPWSLRLVDIQANGKMTFLAEEPRFIGSPDFAEFSHRLAEGLPVKQEATITHLERESDEWRLSTGSGQTWGPFTHIVCSAPAPQTSGLLAGHVDFAQQIGVIKPIPCWTVLLEVDAPLSLNWDAARFSGGSLAWASRQTPFSSAHTWVLQASGSWSEANLEASQESVIEQLCEEFSHAVSLKGTILNARAHRWRYAFHDSPNVQPCYYAAEKRLGACGDWCLGSRVESAWLSGRAMAEMILGLS